MQLPNKLYSYKESSLFLVPIILKRIGTRPVRVEELYLSLKQYTTSHQILLALWTVLLRLGRLILMMKEKYIDVERNLVIRFY